MPHVMVVDRRRTFAEAIAFRVGLEDGMGRVGVATTYSEFRRQLDDVQPDLVVADLEFDDHTLRVFRALQAEQPTAMAIALTESESPALAAAAVRLGARAVLSREESVDRLLAVISGVCQGETHIDPRLLTAVIRELTDPRPSEDQVKLERLTGREREVVELMVAGYDRASIAHQLSVSLNTVKTHCKNILRKLDVHSSLEAVSVALRAGLRPAGELDSDAL